MKNLDCVRVSDVGYIYQNELLGPSGQNDLAHYEIRLRNAMDDQVFRISQEILAEAATQGRFTSQARDQLERWYSSMDENVVPHIDEALDVLIHDGYIEVSDEGHHIPFRLLRDWWAARYRDHHTPLEGRFRRQG